MVDYIFIRGSHTLRVILLYYYSHHHHHIIHTSFHSVFHSHIVDAQYESSMRDRKKPNESSLATTLTNEYFHFFSLFLFVFKCCLLVILKVHLSTSFFTTVLLITDILMRRRRWKTKKKMKQFIVRFTDKTKLNK